MVTEGGPNFVEDEVGPQKGSSDDGEDDPESPEPESYVVHTVASIPGFQRPGAKTV